ncbi:MAG TPA: HAD-IIA family hydrolase [bacterium]
MENKKAIICDIDGVVLQDNSLIPGADVFVKRIMEQGNRFLLLTNFPSQTAGDLQNRLSASALDIPQECFYTSAMATSDFLSKQQGRKAYVVGEGALIHELYRIGFNITDINPDFVVVGETRAFNWEMIQKASYWVMHGARFIATNPDFAGPKGHPACGALCAPIERITGKKPFYVGKPNTWMMSAALNHLKAHAEDAVLIGDNMDTDILAGVQSGLETILVLTGVSQMTDLERYPFRPTHIFPSADKINVV